MNRCNQLYKRFNTLNSNIEIHKFAGYNTKFLRGLKDFKF